MKRTALAGLAATAVLVAGCGSSDDGKDKAAPAKPKSAKTAPSTAGAPTYEQVKAIALKSPQARKLCAKGQEDTTIGAPPAGETYKRLRCGKYEIFDYVKGTTQYRANYKSAVKLDVNDLWSLNGTMFVSSSTFGGPDDLAKDVKALCACGEVAPGQYGK